MSDGSSLLRLAAVQASPALLDRAASVSKACSLIAEAAANGAQLVAFPEGFIPGHPSWFHFHVATGPIAASLSLALFNNALTLPGPELTTLMDTARLNNVYVVIGLCEKIPDTNGTLYNAQVVIGPDGRLLHKRRKFMPTNGERMVHARSSSAGVRVVPTAFGSMSSLICGENFNPLAMFAVTAQYTRVHVMSFPPHFTPKRSIKAGSLMRDQVIAMATAFAHIAKAYIVCACGTLDDAAVSRMQLDAEAAAMVRRDGFCGGSVIIGPNGAILSGPLGSEEGILYADADLEVEALLKLRQDYGGHYNRPDLFRLHVQDAPAQVLDFTANGSERDVSDSPEDRVAAAAATVRESELS